MIRQVIKCLCLATTVSCAASIASADIKIKSKTTTGAQSMVTTTLIKGARTRSSMGFGLDTIDQCDLNRAVMINEKGKRYMLKERPGQKPAAGSQQSFGPDLPYGMKPEKPQKHESKKGVTTYTTTIVDTGERKEMFGYTARHLKLSMVAESSKDACNPVKMKVETDGWYIDLEREPGCAHDAQSNQPNQNPTSECGDQVVYKTVGDGKIGYPVQQTTTTFSQDGRPQVMSVEVTEISKDALDAALFDAPADYKQVNSYPEVMGMTTGSRDAMIDMSAFLEDMGMNSSGGPGGSTIEPKKPGAIRIGVASLENKTEVKFLPPGLRENLISALNGGAIEAVPVRGHTASDIEPDAKKKECDYILYTLLATAKKSTGGGMFGKVSKMTGINAINDKYEAKVEFKLLAVGNSSPVMSSSESANSGGGINALGALQGGLQFTSMFMGGGAMMSQMMMSRLQGMGTNMLMQQLMGDMSQGMGGAMDKKEEAVVTAALSQEAKSVVATVQKRQQ